MRTGAQILWEALHPPSPTGLLSLPVRSAHPVPSASSPPPPPSYPPPHARAPPAGSIIDVPGTG